MMNLIRSSLVSITIVLVSQAALANQGVGLSYVYPVKLTNTSLFDYGLDFNFTSYNQDVNVSSLPIKWNENSGTLMIQTIKGNTSHFYLAYSVSNFIPEQSINWPEEKLCQFSFNSANNTLIVNKLPGSFVNCNLTGSLANNDLSLTLTTATESGSSSSSPHFISSVISYLKDSSLPIKYSYSGSTMESVSQFPLSGNIDTFDYDKEDNVFITPSAKENRSINLTVSVNNDVLCKLQYTSATHSAKWVNQNTSEDSVHCSYRLFQNNLFIFLSNSSNKT